MKLTIILLFASLGLHAQQYHFALTHNRTIGADMGYSYGGWAFVEGGLKTNFQEYYTMPYIGVGVKTEGKLLASISTGYGAVTNIPQRDLPVIKTGYTYKVMSCVYVSGRIGYGKRMQVYAEYTKAGRDWLSVGICLKSK